MEILNAMRTCILKDMLVDLQESCKCTFTRITSIHEFVSPGYIPANWDTEGAEIH